MQLCGSGGRSLFKLVGDDVMRVSHPPTEFSAGLARWPKEQRSYACIPFIHSLTHSTGARSLARATIILMHNKKHSCVLWVSEWVSETSGRPVGGAQQEVSRARVCPYLGCGLILAPTAAPAAADVIRISHIPIPVRLELRKIKTKLQSKLN